MIKGYYSSIDSLMAYEWVRYNWHHIEKWVKLCYLPKSSFVKRAEVLCNEYEVHIAVASPVAKKGLLKYFSQTLHLL